MPSVTERDQQGAPGDGEFPVGFLSVALRTFRAHSAGWWDTYTLDSKERQRAATAGLSARPASPAGWLRGASMRRLRSGLSVEGSRRLGPAAAAAAAASGAAPVRKVQGASWSWTRWTSGFP